MNDNSVTNNTIYNGDARRMKFMYIIYNILQQTPENISGYILFYIIFYSLILYNLSIQATYRRLYINNNTVIFRNYTANSQLDTIKSNLTTHINNMKENITTLARYNLVVTNNEFLLDKLRYKDRISNLNTVRDEYLNRQNDLNRTIKEYNESIKTYNSIKLYATVIIIILIVLVFGIIFMSIMPVFSADTKKMIFIISLIVTITVTILYYNNFKYVNLYEPFTNTIVNSVIDCDSNVAVLDSTRVGETRLYAYIPNQLIQTIEEYNRESKKILNNVQSTYNIVDNKIYTESGNAYLNNIYIQKRELIKANKLQQARLFELIYMTNKDITFIFNIILIILLFIIILLSALVSYTTAPQYLMQIVIICIILSVILLTYFIIVVVQPTRRDYSKYYWANYKPSKEVTGQL